MHGLNSKIIKAYSDLKLSEKQTADSLGVSTRTVRRVLDSAGILRRTRSEAARYLHITKFGKREFKLKKNLSDQDESLKIAGTMLYWGEGAKKGNTIAFSNSDPEMIRVFMHFLRQVCGVDETRLHVSINYYEDHDVRDLTGFWSEITGIPENQFYKPFLHKRRVTGTYRSPSRHGTISVQYSDARLMAVIKDWMTQYRKKLLNK